MLGPLSAGDPRGVAAPVRHGPRAPAAALSPRRPLAPLRRLRLRLRRRRLPPPAGAGLGCVATGSCCVAQRRCRSRRIRARGARTLRAQGRRGSARRSGALGGWVWVLTRVHASRCGQGGGGLGGWLVVLLVCLPCACGTCRSARGKERGVLRWEGDGRVWRCLRLARPTRCFPSPGPGSSLGSKQQDPGRPHPGAAGARGLDGAHPLSARPPSRRRIAPRGCGRPARRPPRPPPAPLSSAALASSPPSSPSSSPRTSPLWRGLRRVAARSPTRPRAAPPHAQDGNNLGAEGAAALGPAFKSLTNLRILGLVSAAVSSVCHVAADALPPRHPPCVCVNDSASSRHARLACFLCVLRRSSSSALPPHHAHPHPRHRACIRPPIPRLEGPGSPGLLRVGAAGGSGGSGLHVERPAHTTTHARIYVHKNTRARTHTHTLWSDHQLLPPSP